MSLVAFCDTPDRPYGVKTIMATLEAGGALASPKGKDVFVKPNFNTSDPAPGSTHNDTLLTMIDELWDRGAKSITLGERSCRTTFECMQEKGILPELKKREVKVINFDELKSSGWVKVKEPGHHWPKGFKVARPLMEAEYLALTCCLKTHQYGGVFTLSLKLAVGVAPSRSVDAKYMNELHSSVHQRRMIAELNTAFDPKLIILDGVDAFVDGGPATGERVSGNVFLGAADRVAIDAVGVACLKELGSNEAVMNTPIYRQEQIARAVELGLGAASPADISMSPADAASRGRCAKVAQILSQG